MTITSKDTIADVIRTNGTLFKLGIKEITNQIKMLPNPETITLRHKILPTKKIKARSVADATIGELDVLNDRTTAEKYFFNVIGVMLGFVRFNKTLPDGNPDWVAGWEIEEKNILNLCFIEAFRYFIQIQTELEGAAKAWGTLGKWDKKRRKKRPDRGLISICRQYCRLVEGAVKPVEVWNLPWPMVFEAFESCDYDNKEQAEAYESTKKQYKPRKR